MKEERKESIKREIDNRIRHILALEREYDWEMERYEDSKSEEEAEFIKGLLDKLQSIKEIEEGEVRRLKNLLDLGMERRCVKCME